MLMLNVILGDTWEPDVFIMASILRRCHFNGVIGRSAEIGNLCIIVPSCEMAKFFIQRFLFFGHKIFWSGARAGMIFRKYCLTKFVQRNVPSRAFQEGDCALFFWLSLRSALRTYCLRIILLSFPVSTPAFVHFWTQAALINYPLANVDLSIDKI